MKRHQYTVAMALLAVAVYIVFIECRKPSRKKVPQTLSPSAATVEYVDINHEILAAKRRLREAMDQKQREIAILDEYKEYIEYYRGREKMGEDRSRELHATRAMIGKQELQVASAVNEVDMARYNLQYWEEKQKGTK